MKVLIAYHSDYGSTEKMAKAIAAGMRSSVPETQIELKQAGNTAPNDLLGADVIVFGTPVHMGSMAWQMKKLIDESASLWMENALQGKVGGVFVSGGGFGGAGGGAELTMAGLHANFLEHGMLVVGFPKSTLGYAEGGLHWGAYARSGNHEGMPAGISDSQLTAARSYGAHLIEVAERLFD
ncbi:MAG: Trp repressor-binding protein [Zetaproteobacteria bacterium CG12_big_fil_rev_8_21_14_0_65_55_1124]|nr:MAG: Trp repressor-binding protein [Zetaproteobacteria bacterium CG1_02_55_237]PIS18532.1 MAG: Trp repressor-binding protein [Zetaproteobacteria bacterium CG08_land_8_20_14_0_20_55_17]PIW42009.1 MAG: Trp repressor-binding protein [Zetaproteobacteria bacterium CG12_big_fil_rev_8_21_14_0_65_55_1124]PIY53914.1 MAG: Trp repressor-binding protein [Zetaproteobacteria bacterium CG_4_10_14_0_8_um_filter_55_43]PIZ39359.1 MAG: Trp repressor-binding protein [Zetaproteobacteria bacterium CG_4_10_14_0_2_